MSIVFGEYIPFLDVSTEELRIEEAQTLQSMEACSLVWPILYALRHFLHLPGGNWPAEMRNIWNDDGCFLFACKKMYFSKA